MTEETHPSYDTLGYGPEAIDDIWAVASAFNVLSDRVDAHDMSNSIAVKTPMRVDDHDDGPAGRARLRYMSRDHTAMIDASVGWIPTLPTDRHGLIRHMPITQLYGAIKNLRADVKKQKPKQQGGIRIRGVDDACDCDVCDDPETPTILFSHDAYPNMYYHAEYEREARHATDQFEHGDKHPKPLVRYIPLPRIEWRKTPTNVHGESPGRASYCHASVDPGAVRRALLAYTARWPRRTGTPRSRGSTCGRLKTKPGRPLWSRHTTTPYGGCTSRTRRWRMWKSTTRTGSRTWQSRSRVQPRSTIP